MKLINLFGGPGTGKSTIAAQIFSKLKWNEINSELVTEYAKDVVWDEAYKKLENQIYIFGKQLHKLWSVKDKVDVVITDGPVVLSLIYGKKMDPHFNQLVLNEFNKFDSINIFLTRHKPYNPIGRTQTEYEARNIDDVVFNTLHYYNIEHTTWPAKEEKMDELFEFILSEVKK